MSDFNDIEASLRRALGGRMTKKRKAGEPLEVPSITVVLNCRPADNVGLNVIHRKTVRTVSRFEAELEAFKEVRSLGLRYPVIIAFE